MGTEDISRRYRGIETWPDPEVLETLVEAQLSGVAAVRAALTALASAAEAAVARLRRGGRLVYAGAGTSIRLGVQDGVELTPTYGWLADRTVFLVAGGYDALTKAIEGAEDDRAAGAAAARSEDLGKLDVTIAISASGQTPYTLGAVEEARNLGALTIGIACNPDAPLLTSVEHRVLIDTGPESIAGSTRLKAGTAQKVTLNLLSTLIMIRLGRVFDGLMVDVVATNAKLVSANKSFRIAQAENLRALQVEEETLSGLTPTFLNLKLQTQAGLANARIAEFTSAVNFNKALATLYMAAGTTLEMHQISLDNVLTMDP